MATPGQNETYNGTAPGSTDGNTTGAGDGKPNGDPDVDDIPESNNNQYQLMEGDDGEDFDDDDMKSEDNDVNLDKPFGGYAVAAKNNIEAGKGFKKSDIIKQAMDQMQRDINLGEFERKENEELLEDHFKKLFETLNNKKQELLSNINKYYDDHKQDSLQRINELKSQYDAQLELEKDINYNEIEDQMMANIAPQGNDNNSNIFKRQLTKLKSKVGLDENKENKAAEEEDMAKKPHDKLRIFFPTKGLNEIITEEIRVGNDWWNSLKLDHTEFNLHGSKIWRIKKLGWYNAFGSCKVGYTQKKRWSIKILPTGNCDLSQPADLVIGVIDNEKVDKLFNKNKGKGKKAVGFWSKGYEGFGFYGWNGKIFHKQKRGKAYGTAFNVNNVIGVELDMGLKLEEGNNDGKNANAKGKKSKAKVNKAKNVKNGVMIASGATITFYVNDKDVGIAFYDIDISKEYVLAVALNSNNYVLQLL